MTSLKALIAKVADGKALSREEAKDAFDIMMSGEATPSQIGGFLLALFETSIAKMRVFRVPEFLGAALMLGLLATLLLFVSRSL